MLADVRRGVARYSAAILVGGRAARFGGRDKGALIVDGETIRQRQLAMLSTVCDEILVVGGDRRGDGDDEPARYIPDIVAGLGPMSGVHAAVTAARHDAVLVIACDMPFVTAPFASYLLELSDSADVVVPRTERGYHPLCGVYTRACLTPLARRLADRKLKMIELFADIRARVVVAEEIGRFGDPHRLLANVNTPAEYANLEAFHSHER